MTSVTEAFIERVLQALPGLRPQYETTAAECAAEGLPGAGPEMFIFEHTAKLIEQALQDPAATGQVEALAFVLDAEYGIDESIDALIESSFLVLMGDGAGRPDPATVLGPKLAEKLGVERAWRAAPADVAFVERLTTAIPALHPVARENVYGANEDVLVHIFLGDVVHREVENFEAGRLDEVRAVIAALEAEWGGEVDEPIAVSFVENLPYPDQRGAGLNALLGPKLKAELARQRTAENST